MIIIRTPLQALTVQATSLKVFNVHFQSNAVISLDNRYRHCKHHLPYRSAAPANKIAIMFSTILVVQFGMDITKAFYANKLRDKISVKFVHRLNYIAGAALIIASFIILDRLVTHFVFPALPSSD